jgi:hypothetical protein
MEFIVIGPPESLTRLYQATYHWTRAHNYKGGELVSASWPMGYVGANQGRILVLNSKIAEGDVVLECLAVAAEVKCYRQVV